MSEKCNIYCIHKIIAEYAFKCLKNVIFIVYTSQSLISSACLVVQLDHMGLIKALIVFGADVEIHNALGETPGLIAARSSKGEAGWMREGEREKGRERGRERGGERSRDGPFQ